MLSPKQIEFLEVCPSCGEDLLCSNCDSDSILEIAQEAAADYHEARREAYD